MRTSRFAEELAAEDAKHPPVVEPDNGQASVAPEAPQGPRYEFHRPWYSRFIGKGCNRCGGQPPGWVQKQIQTPLRFKRLALWIVNLVPRGTSFVRVMVSGRVDSEQYAERQASCASCPAAVIQLRAVKGEIRETSWCSQCECPKWHYSKNKVRNWRAAWSCPIRRHDASDPNAAFVAYLRSKQEVAAGATGTGDDRGVDATERGDN